MAQDALNDFLVSTQLIRIRRNATPEVHLACSRSPRPAFIGLHVIFRFARPLRFAGLSAVPQQRQFRFQRPLRHSLMWSGSGETLDVRNCGGGLHTVRVILIQFSD